MITDTGIRIIASRSVPDNVIVGIAAENVQAGSLLTVTTSGTFELARTDADKFWRQEYKAQFIEEKTIQDKAVKDCTVQELLFAVRQKTKNESL